MSHPTVDVLYVSYAKDLEWFKWSLKVLQKNLTGYRHIIVVVHKDNMPLFEPIGAERNISVWEAHSSSITNGYYWQQWVKMNAPSYTDAEYILHIDSDTFIGRPTDVMDYFVEGRPAWMWSYYTDFKDPVPWQAPTEFATGMKCDREFMQAQPFVIHRGSYPPVVAGMHDTLERASRSGSRFSEYNVLGRLAWEFEHDKYHWVDRNRDPWPKGYHATRQFWSHAPIGDHMPEIMNMLGDGDEQHIRTTDRGIWVLSNDTHISRWVEQHHRLDFDGHLLPRIVRLIKKGDVVVDVGAFIGDHTHAYAKATAGVDSGRVLAFEPNSTPFDALTRNMAGHGHVECINKALGAWPGRMAISHSPNAGASHLVAGGEVEVATLDSYALTRCDLIKVDAEGFEFYVMQGAWQTISRCKPILALEINRGALARNGVLPEDIYDWLKLRGYRIEGHENSPQYDIFAYPKGK